MTIKLSELLRGYARRRGIAQQVEAAMVLELFTRVSGDVLGSAHSASVKPLYFKEGTITVAVESPVLAQELKLHERIIVERINKKRGTASVKSLRFLS